MSTRALYTFKGKNSKDSWNVYKHHDGYPTGAADTLQTALDFFAWQLPRYEPDEFAAAFIAAGKSHWIHRGEFDASQFEQYGPKGAYRSSAGGGVRLMPQGQPQKVAQHNCCDIEYRYEIYRGNDSTLRVKAYEVNAWESYSETLLTDCPLSEFTQWAKAHEDVAA